ncbi:MAG: SPOR domain-containing protein [Spirochaetaceae bacterium]|nr:MAG: SPOR domain-containing protein [Spirochaetaceae bacterium]
MGFRSVFPTLLAAVLLLITTIVAAGQDAGRQTDQAAADTLLMEARKLSSEGKLQDVAAAYTKWLAENAGHPSFGMILIEAADSQLSIERALELLRVYTPRVQDPEQRDLCRASQIDLLEMLGRTEQALGLLRSFPSTPPWLYRQAQLLYQQGLTEEAEKSLEQALKALLSAETGISEGSNGLDSSIAHGADTTELEARIRLLQARIYVRAEKQKEAENLFELLTVKYAAANVAPVILLAYYEYLLDQGRAEAAAKQLEKLAEKFPESPELALARASEQEGRISYAPLPSRLLPRELPLAAGTSPDGGKEPPPIVQPPTETGQAAPQAATPAAESRLENQTVLVQTGSFRDRENAQYMVRDLKDSGFEAGIVEKRIGGTLYYRVVIGPLMTMDKAQALLMKLKDARFEGVLLFQE